jgi:hypothetical protein
MPLYPIAFPAQRGYIAAIVPIWTNCKLLYSSFAPERFRRWWRARTEPSPTEQRDRDQRLYIGYGLVRVALFFIGISLFSIGAIAQDYSCLSSNVKETDVSIARMGMTRSGTPAPVRVTVKQVLKQLRARCIKRKLVDRGGREVRFYFLNGCWGNPPSDYLEILDRQRRELVRLRKRYTVIEMTCNPSGIPIP